MSPQQEQGSVPQCPGLLAAGLVPAPPPLSWGHAWAMLGLGVSLGSAVTAGSLPWRRVSGDMAALINGTLSSSSSTRRLQWPGPGSGQSLGQGFKAH